MRCGASAIHGIIRAINPGGHVFNRITVVAIVVLTSSAALFADAKDDVAAAVKRLSESDNYSWTTSSQGPQGKLAGGGEGKTQRDGLTILNLGVPDAMTTIIFKRGRGAFHPADGEWQAVGGDNGSATTAPNPSGDARMIASMIATYRPPAEQARDLAGKAQDLHKSADDDSVGGTLSADDAKTLIQRRIVRGAGGAVEVKNPSATVKFWISDGLPRKFQFHI